MTSISKKLSLENLYNSFYKHFKLFLGAVPQFDFSTYSSQIFWLLVCFGIFFAYVKFYFLPKLEGILNKRNKEIQTTKEEIEANNRQANANFEAAQENIKNTHALANKIISDAEEKAKFDEDQTLNEIEQAQKKAIEEVLSKQKEGFSKEIINKAVLECSEIVLKNIGMDIKTEELAKTLKSMQK